VNVKPAPLPTERTERIDPAHEYRVILWEQPEMEGVEPERIGWGETTFDVTDAESIHQAIAWAKKRLAEKGGPYRGESARDRDYVIYAKVPGEDRFLHVAGWDPTRAPGQTTYAGIQAADAQGEVATTRALGLEVEPR
jgi:hypothetical protein